MHDELQELRVNYAALQQAKKDVAYLLLVVLLAIAAGTLLGSASFFVAGVPGNFLAGGALGCAFCGIAVLLMVRLWGWPEGS